MLLYYFVFILFLAIINPSPDHYYRAVILWSICFDDDDDNDARGRRVTISSVFS